MSVGKLADNSSITAIETWIEYAARAEFLSSVLLMYYLFYAIIFIRLAILLINILIGARDSLDEAELIITSYRLPLLTYHKSFDMERWQR